MPHKSILINPYVPPYFMVYVVNNFQRWLSAIPAINIQTWAGHLMDFDQLNLVKIIF